MVKPESHVGGALWKAASLMGIPAITMAAGLWRDVALQAQTLETLRAGVGAQHSALAQHLDTERHRLDVAAEAEKNTAVDRARLGAVIDQLKGQIDALLASLSRRRPG
jgi:hypothetical protein